MNRKTALSKPFGRWKLIFLGLVFPLLAQSQTPGNYKKNDHVRFNVVEKNEVFLIDYSFRDHLGVSRSVKLNYPVDQTRKMIRKFGIPKKLLGPYLVTPEIIEARTRMMRDGLFSSGKVITADLSAVTSYYRPFCEQIAAQLLRTLREEDSDTREARIEMAMKFVQDIPYGVPDFDNEQRYYGGLATPPEVMLYQYGDCDSKSVLFAGILSYMINPTDVVFLRSPDHVLTGIKGTPRKGQYYVHNAADGHQYILAETAGPGRVQWGNPGSNFDSKEEYRIEKLELTSFKDAEWKAGDRGYFFFVNGKSITHRLHNSWVGDDLIVYDTEEKTSYLLENFRNQRDLETRPARFLVGPAFWMKEDGNYFFYVAGQSAGPRTINEWRGSDLVVTDKSTGKRYLLPNFRQAPESKLQIAYLLE